MRNQTKALRNWRWAMEVRKHPHRYSFAEIKQAFDYVLEETQAQ